MGFKCPLCLEDFGRNKEAWEKHCKEAHKGSAKIIVQAVTDLTAETEAEAVQAGTEWLESMVEQGE